MWVLVMRILGIDFSLNIREDIDVDVILRMFRPPKPTLSSKESIVLEKIPRFFLQIHKSSLPLHRFPMG